MGNFIGELRKVNITSPHYYITNFWQISKAKTRLFSESIGEYECARVSYREYTIDIREHTEMIKFGFSGR